ncbi:MAG: sialate O-acetylesterase, partial [Verrucomicrobiales bacterium]
PTPHHPFEPGFLYAAGIRPLEGMALRGFLWYQGESNATEGGAGTAAIDPAMNKSKFVSLIESWRDAWGDRSLPFYFVQLPGLNRDWALFREMQLQVSQEIPDTGMAVTIDVGHPTNVHPIDKRPVGERLARMALEKIYGKAVSGLSPTLLRSGRSGELTELVFSAPLTTSDLQPPRGFILAGPDRQFYPAAATIDGDRVSLESASVPNPSAIRYAWENDPDVNLTGTNALPVSPFRTDAWPIGTGEVTSHLPDPGARYRTSFEGLQAAPLLEAQLGGAVWSAAPGHARITREFAHQGDQSLHLSGGVDRAVTASFEEPLGAGAVLAFWAERWTRRLPYAFRVEAKCAGQWQEIYRGDREVRVGRPFLSAVKCSVPDGATALRFSGSAPSNAGTLIDDVVIRVPDPE